jgi:hypothetical protein
MSSFNGQVSSSLPGVTGRVARAIATASHRTGVDFNYLLGQAQIESSMNPTARANTSSATGLYQFIDQSWLAIINDHGAKYGMDWASGAIERTDAGRYYVADPALREQILALRNHPETASVMAAELASDNRDYLEQRIGRPAEPVDLYLAHFLGAGSAARFLTSLAASPSTPGAALFPAAARSNSGVFYDRQGNARSLSDIRALFERKLASGAQSASFGEDGGEGGDALPDGTPMVQPADYVRIARSQMSGEEALAGQQMLAARQPYSELAPRAETARLAYLMLATFGR